MIIEKFESNHLRDLWTPENGTGKFNGGQVTIVGGSSLFHGAPVLALKAASRVVSMVYFATPLADRPVVEEVQIKSSLSNFIWVPREDIDGYLTKSDAALVGPGMMRNRSESGLWVCDGEGEKTRQLTVQLLKKFPDKKWVVDGGSLQVIGVNDLVRGAIVTPNRKEYEMLFGEVLADDVGEVARQIELQSKRWGVVIVFKSKQSLITDGNRTVMVEGGNDGLTRGGVGDLLAGLTVALFAKNEAILAAAAASYLVKKAAEELEDERGLMFNSDDVAEKIPLVYGRLVK